MTTKDLVLLGGGHSHVEVLRTFGHYARHNHHQRGRTNRTNDYRHRDSHQGALLTSAGLHKPQEDLAGCSHADNSGSGGTTGPSGYQLTLITRGRFTPYSGMLPGWVSGFYSYDDCHIDLKRLASYAGAQMILASASGIDISARTVRCFGSGDGDDDDGGDVLKAVQPPPVPYDVLSIDIGITPGSAAVPGADEHVTLVKPIDGFVRRYERLLERYRAALAAVGPERMTSSATRVMEGDGAKDPKASSEPLIRVCIVGGGAGGVELAAAVRHRLEEERRRGGWSAHHTSAAVSCSLLCRGDLLPGHPPHVRRLVRQLLTQRGVEIRSEDAVARVAAGELIMSSGVRVPFDECLWCTEASPAPWLSQTGLPTDKKGFLAINEYLQSDGGPPEIFAAGDVATSSTHPRPKAGVFAVRQGPPLAHNLRASLEGDPLRPFVPQTTALALITLGDRFCVASRTGRISKAAPSTGRRHHHQQQQQQQQQQRWDVGDKYKDGQDGKDEFRSNKEEEQEEVGEWLLGWLLNGCGGLFVSVTGPLLWRWKDSIDRSFMRRYGQQGLQVKT